MTDIEKLRIRLISEAINHMRSWNVKNTRHSIGSDTCWYPEDFLTRSKLNAPDTRSAIECIGQATYDVGIRICNIRSDFNILTAFTI